MKEFILLHTRLLFLKLILRNSRYSKWLLKKGLFQKYFEYKISKQLCFLYYI